MTRADVLSEAYDLYEIDSGFVVNHTQIFGGIRLVFLISCLVGTRGAWFCRVFHEVYWCMGAWVPFGADKTIGSWKDPQSRPGDHPRSHFHYAFLSLWSLSSPLC